MRQNKEHKQWLKERDEAAYSFDVDKLKAFYRKWAKRGIYEYKGLQSDEVLEIAMRKMVCAMANPREDKLAEARAWLSERGYSWTSRRKGAKMSNEKICGNCKYHQHEDWTDGWVCVNDRSDYCTCWTEYRDYCEEFEERSE